MKYATRLLSIVFLGMCVTLAAEPGMASAGGAIALPFVVSAGAEQEVNVSAAYNSQRQEYLAVWFNDRPGNDDIRAQRLSRNGAPIGGPFYISAGVGAERRYPDVAYNSTWNEYLVVWEQSTASTGTGIYGRRVSATGQVDESDIVIESAGYNLYTPATPAVAYASISDKYLVVWEETYHPGSITYDIYGRVVSSAGVPEAGVTTISQGPEQREHPDVAYNRHADRYLVVWTQKPADVWDIHGRQVNGSGGVYQGDITLSFWTVSATAPAVAAIASSPTNDKFLVVYELHYGPVDWDIWGRLVREDGSPGAEFCVNCTKVASSSPAVAGTESGNQYLVTWRHAVGATNVPIYGRAVSYAGALLGREAEFPGYAAAFPAVTAGPVGDFLVAWHDQPASATSTNIYGQLWGNRSYLPGVLRQP